VLDQRVRKGVTEYRVHWEGYAKSASTWEPEHCLQDEDGEDLEVLQKFKTHRRLALESKQKKKSTTQTHTVPTQPSTTTTPRKRGRPPKSVTSSATTLTHSSSPTVPSKTSVPPTVVQSKPSKHS
jgi:hypothetical protein